MAKSRLYWVAMALITCLISWGVYYGIAVHYQKADPVFIATIVILSLFIHELGHAVVLELNGVQTKMFFAVIGAGVMPQPQAVPKFKQLSWETMAKLSLAGVIGNLVFVGLSYGANLVGVISASQFGRIAALNGNLIFFNLLPFGLVDGGRFTNALFDSLPEDLDLPFARVTGYAILAVAIAVTLITPYSFLIIGWLFLWGVIQKAKHDNAHGSYDQRAMSIADCRTWSAVYVALAIIGLLLMLVRKNWIA